MPYQSRHDIQTGLTSDEAAKAEQMPSHARNERRLVLLVSLSAVGAAALVAWNLVS